MVADQSERLGMPLLQAGQAQKEIYHNEALTMIDLLLHGAVEASGLDVPPVAPVEGQCWIVGAAPVGDWAGRAGEIAGWTAGGWRFVNPRAGMALWHKGGGVVVRHDGTQWSSGEVPATALHIGGIQVVGSQQPAITAPAGGSVIDTQSRLAIGAILNALEAHGLIAL